MVEIIVAVIGAVAVIGGAVVTALIPLVRRTTRGAVAEDGEATRAATVDAMDVVLTRVEALGERLDSRIDDVRDDLDEVREGVTRVREWQAGHDAEHLLIGQRPRPNGESS
ncbi:hypothetical protein ACIQMR_35210 [Streptomyces sp. NPDC091376]|uniref:hypothetical protein n=1 Tax=Streptomyces sp. NPDC091376 TaxID=3365994 RepID=UPI00380CD6CD